MSELKSYNTKYEQVLGEVYLKSEADKVIAELEESHKMEVEQLLILNREQANAANRLRDSMERVIRHNKYKHWIEEVAKHNTYDKFKSDVFNEEREPQVKVTIKKKSIGFGHCLVCVEYYWKIVYGIRTFVFGSKKEFEFASCGRDLRSIAEMMNNFHHERLSKAWRMIYG